MYKTIAGHHIKSIARFKHWEPLLEAWFAVHQTYIDKTEDAAYWYTERTNIGILAQAAWKAGYIALEEYQTKKIAHHAPDAKSNGRCDLWISDSSTADVIEAKQQYIQLGSSRNTKVADSHLQRATADAKRTIGKSDEDAVGLVFLPAYIRVANCQPQDIKNQIALSTEMLKATNADLVAWCFPGKSRALKGQNGLNYIPGLFLLASAITADA